MSTTAGKKKVSSKAWSGTPARPARKKAAAKRKAAPAKAARPSAQQIASSKAHPPAKKVAARSVTSTATKPSAKAAAKPAAKTAEGTPNPRRKPGQGRAATRSTPAPARRTPLPSRPQVDRPSPPVRPPADGRAAGAAGATPVAGAPIAFPAGVVPRKPGRGTRSTSSPRCRRLCRRRLHDSPTGSRRLARPPTRQMKTEEIDTPRESRSGSEARQCLEVQSGRELSDAEVLAMPDAEYMNDKADRVLQGEARRARRPPAATPARPPISCARTPPYVPDPADRATIEEEHALELRTRDRERKLLKKISQSLARPAAPPLPPASVTKIGSPTALRVDVQPRWAVAGSSMQAPSQFRRSQVVSARLVSQPPVPTCALLQSHVPCGQVASAPAAWAMNDDKPNRTCSALLMQGKLSWSGPGAVAPGARENRLDVVAGDVDHQMDRRNRGGEADVAARASKRAGTLRVAHRNHHAVRDVLPGE